jgi:hypothetical protein
MASSALSYTSKAAVGMAYRFIKSLANALLVSNFAAAWLGPKIFNPFTLAWKGRTRENIFNGP